METPTITPETVKEETQEKKLDLPRMENALSHYDKEKNMFWVAIPVDKVDAFTAACILDSMKLNYITVFRDAFTRLQEQKSKIVTPSMINRMRENFVRRKQK